jgi:serine/threonine protein kinase
VLTIERCDLGILNLLSTPVIVPVKSSIAHPAQVVARPDTSEALRYDILGVLGEGGSGVTYRALDTTTGQLVALKALSLHQIDDWKAIELFEREAQVLSTLDREGIPKYIDYFTTDLDGDSPRERLRQRYFYIVQELAPGKNLLDWMRSGWRVSEAEVKTIAIQILEILIYLHRHYPPIVHRDLKPSNILKTEDGKIFLVDFGAVQQTYHDTFMRGSTVVGTYGYMAPEQFRGQAVPATDLYGLGATILHLLTHRSPAEIPQDGLRLNFRDRLQVSSSFADWLERMLEPDVGNRFSSSTKALEVLKTPPKSKFKPTFSKLDRTLIGITSLTCLVLLFGLFDRYKYYWLGVAGFTATEPFQVISERPNVSQIQTYLDRGFDVNAKDANNRSLIYYAMNKDLPDIVKMLIERGADTSDAANLIDAEAEKLKNIQSNKRDEDNRLNQIYDPNKASLQQQNEEKYLKSKKQIEDNYVNGIAYYAVQHNRVAILELLLKRGFNPNRTYPDDNKISFLHLASVHPDGAIIKLLLDRGIDPNIQDSLGCTPLHTAIVQDLMPYNYKLSSYVSFDRANNAISKQAIVYLMQAGAKSDVSCNLNDRLPKDRPSYRRWDRTYYSTGDKIDTVGKLIASKGFDRYGIDMNQYSTPYQLLPFFDSTGIDLNSYGRSN